MKDNRRITDKSNKPSEPEKKRKTYTQIRAESLENKWREDTPEPKVDTRSTWEKTPKDTKYSDEDSDGGTWGISQKDERLKRERERGSRISYSRKDTSETRKTSLSMDRMSTLASKSITEAYAASDSMYARELVSSPTQNPLDSFIRENTPHDELHPRLLTNEQIAYARRAHVHAFIASTSTHYGGAFNDLKESIPKGVRKGERSHLSPKTLQKTIDAWRALEQHENSFVRGKLSEIANDIKKDINVSTSDITAQDTFLLDGGNQPELLTDKQISFLRRVHLVKIVPNADRDYGGVFKDLKEVLPEGVRKGDPSYSPDVLQNIKNAWRALERNDSVLVRGRLLKIAEAVKKDIE